MRGVTTERLELLHNISSIAKKKERKKNKEKESNNIIKKKNTEKINEKLKIIGKNGPKFIKLSQSMLMDKFSN